MKRFVIIIGVLISLILPNVVYANTIPSYLIEELRDNQADYLEIIDLQQPIIDMIKDIRENFQYKQLNEDYQIDITSAKKIYVDTDIFSLDTSNTSEIIDELEQSTYMWLLLVTVGSDTYQVNIAKGLPLDKSIAGMLTDEEIQRIKDEEGKWSISGIEILEGRILDYERIINNNLQRIHYDSDAKIVLCGGLKHINQPVALVMNQEEVELLIPLYDLQIDGTNEEIESIKPKNAKNEVYLYNGIKDAVNGMEGQNEVYVGGGGYIKLQSNQSMYQRNMIIVLIVVAVLSSLFGIYYKLKKHNLKQ